MIHHRSYGTTHLVEDRAIALWEVDSFDRLDDFTHGQIWQTFERWLIGHFPATEWIFTDDDEPGDDPMGNRVFLRDIGYAPVAGTNRILAKEVQR